MSEITPENVENTNPGETPEQQSCNQCQRSVAVGDGIKTEGAFFCRPCYGELKGALEQAVAAQSEGINFAGAVGGGIAGGMLGALVWWGFVTITNIQFGLVAIVIGWAVGKGVVILSGHKRALSLQLISVAIAAVSYALASYWVIRTAILDYYADSGNVVSLPWFPQPDLLFEVVSPTFELFDFVFVAIALWQAWRMPAPFNLNAGD